jgi:hypothetical protein
MDLVITDTSGVSGQPFRFNSKLGVNCERRAIRNNTKVFIGNLVVLRRPG